MIFETLKMRKKVHQAIEELFQELSKENGKDDTELRDFAAKFNRQDAAVQLQQSTRSLETSQLEFQDAVVAKDAEAAKRGKPEVRKLNSMTREELYYSGADKRLSEMKRTMQPSLIMRNM